jgi:hypothetical protein
VTKPQGSDCLHVVVVVVVVVVINNNNNNNNTIFIIIFLLVCGNSARFRTKFSRLPGFETIDFQSPSQKCGKRLLALSCLSVRMEQLSSH